MTRKTNCYIKLRTKNEAMRRSNKTPPTIIVRGSTEAWEGRGDRGGRGRATDKTVVLNITAKGDASKNDVT